MHQCQIARYVTHAVKLLVCVCVRHMSDGPYGSRKRYRKHVASLDFSTRYGIKPLTPQPQFEQRHNSTYPRDD